MPKVITSYDLGDCRSLLHIYCSFGICLARLLWLRIRSRTVSGVRSVRIQQPAGGKVRGRGKGATGRGQSRLCGALPQPPLGLAGTARQETSAPPLFRCAALLAQHDGVGRGLARRDGGRSAAASRPGAAPPLAFSRLLSVEIITRNNAEKMHI